MKPLTPSERHGLDLLLGAAEPDGDQEAGEQAIADLHVRGLVVIGLGIGDDDTTITLTDLGALALRVDAAAVVLAAKGGA